MQGIWKQDVSGWDRKGNKRKKVTRNRILRDKGRALINVYDSYRGEKRGNKKQDFIFIIEKQMEIVYNEHIYKKSGFVETWKIEVYKTLPNDRFSINIRTAYYYFGTWYDEYTNEPICGEIQKLSYLYKVEIEYEKPMLVKRDYKGFGIYDAHDIYLYGKFLPKWKMNTFYDDGKRRKIAQKYANSMDRQNIRKWINKEDWDTEVKTHALSKSILWEIW